MIAIAGAGAFGTALAVALGREGRAVTLWARDVGEMAERRRNARYLPGVDLPETVTVTADRDVFARAEVVLLAVPMQALGGFVEANAALFGGKWLVACCKGVDMATLQGPSAVIRARCADAQIAVLTGPSFAADIARGLPTALTLAGADEALQARLSTPSLRLYRSADVVGAELGGALKNVMAIAAGVVMGAGLGDSARAALMTRGFTEMQRFALAKGARAETLAGLSGLGDLILTCTSAQSRNFRFGQAMGQGAAFDPTITVEGSATAVAVAKIAQRDGIEMPITQMIAALMAQEITLRQAIQALMSRPLKEE
ncbi:GpsA Glycerol-3-phosphate dehydrogenase [Paracoccaceae bacterium]